MANGMEIASLFAKVGADVSDFEKGMKKVKDDMSFMDKGMSGLQNVAKAGFAAVAVAGTAAFAAVTAGIGKAITEAGNMEQQAANISAVFADMAPPVDEVKTLINQLALDPSLVVGIEDAGAGIEMLAKNGLTWDQIAQGAARSTILMANATGADLSMSADLATNAMGIFGLQVEDLDNIVATFTNSANKSQFTVNDWGYVLANAGPAANAFGYDLEELFAAVTLTSSGFASGREAGTSFEYLLKGLTPSTVTAKDEMKKLGLMTEDGANAFFNADGTAKALDETMRILQQAFGGLTQEQAMSSSEAIFGATAYGALQGVLNMNLDTYKELIPQMTDFSAVEEGARTRTATFQGAMSALNDTINSVFVMVGDKFIPIITAMARQFAEFVKTNAPALIEWAGTFAERIDNLTSLFQRGVLVFEDGSGILAGLLELFGVGSDRAQELGQQFYDLTGAMAATWASIQSAFSPLTTIISQFFSWKDILAVVAGVVASIVIPAVYAFIAAAWPVVALFAAMVAASALLRNAWENDWFGIQGITDTVINYVMDLFGPFLRTISEFGGEALREIIAWATGNETQFNAVGRIWDAAKEMARRLFNDILYFATTTLPQWLATLDDWARAGWAWLVTATTEAVKQIGEWGSALWRWVQDNLPTWTDNLTRWATAAWQWIVTATSQALAKLGEWGSAILGWLAANLPNFLAMIFQWATALAQWITDVIPTAINNLADFVAGMREEGEGNGLRSFIDMALKWANALWRWIVDELIPEVGPAYMQFMTAMGNYGLQLLQALGHLAVELGITLWEWIVKVTPVAVQKLGEWGNALWGWIQSNLPSWTQKLTLWATAAWQWIVEASGPALQKLGEWGSALWGWVQANAPQWVQRLAEWGVAAWQWIVEASGPALTKLGEWGAKLWDWVKTNAPTWRDKLLEWAGIAWQWIRDVAIPEATKKLGEWGAALWEWVKTNAPTWRDKLGEWAKAAWQWITDTAIPEAKKKMGEWGSMLLQWVTDNVQGWITKFKDAGRDIIQGLRDGIEGKWNDLKTWFSGVWGSLVDNFKNFFGIASPSKLFMDFGGDLMIGLQEGIEAYVPPVINAVKQLAKDVGNEVSKIAESVGNSLTAATPQLDNYYKKLLDAKVAALALASMPTLPTYTPPPNTAPPVLTNPNGGTQTPVVSPSSGGSGGYGFKDLSEALNGLTGFVDISDTMADIHDFATKAFTLFSAQGQLQGSSPELLAIRSLTGAGAETLSVNNILIALQTLITEIRARGLGSQFNITQAPDASLQQQTELEELATYLNALYG